MIPTVVLAAGMSTRFPGNKLLYKVGGKPLIRLLIENILKSKTDEVVVVTGYEAGKIGEVLRGLPVRFVFNERYMEGMSSSVKKGLSYVKDRAEAVLFHPADVFFVPPKVFDMVIDHYKETKAKIVVAGFKGFKGHPILFSRELFDDIMMISEETMGLKMVTKKYRNEIKVVETGVEEVLIDIDTLDDLMNYLSKRGVR
ncbi:MAG TPA: nucleotidyltransferase family protein [Acidilobales archaeon]|nr:nucleotidyltransferase family protein [Acidilobales archaeon]